jgi:hypothetical protein
MRKVSFTIALVSSLAGTGIAALLLTATGKEVYWQTLAFCFVSSFGSILLVQGGRR